MKMWEKESPVTVVFFFLTTHPNGGAEGRHRSRVGVLERKFTTEQVKMWPCLFCESCAASRHLYPLWRQEHPVYASRGIWSPTFSPCACGGANTRPQLWKGNMHQAQVVSTLHVTGHGSDVSTCHKCDPPIRHQGSIWGILFELWGGNTLLSLFLWVSCCKSGNHKGLAKETSRETRGKKWVLTSFEPNSSDAKSES